MGRCLEAPADAFFSTDLVSRPLEIGPLYGGFATLEAATNHQLTIEKQQRLSTPISMVPDLATDVCVIGFPYEFENKFAFTNHSFWIYVVSAGILYKAPTGGRLGFLRP